MGRNGLFLEALLCARHTELPCSPPQAPGAELISTPSQGRGDSLEPGACLLAAVTPAVPNAGAAGALRLGWSPGLPVSLSMCTAGVTAARQGAGTVVPTWGPQQGPEPSADSCTCAGGGRAQGPDGAATASASVPVRAAFLGKSPHVMSLRHRHRCCRHHHRRRCLASHHLLTVSPSSPPLVRITWCLSWGLGVAVTPGHRWGGGAT